MKFFDKFFPFTYLAGFLKLFIACCQIVLNGFVKRYLQPSNRMDKVNRIERKVSPDLIRTITVRTCVGIYDDLRKQQPKYYRKAPDDGIDLTIEYVDTVHDAEGSSFDKTVVAIHGLPGNFSHFDRLIEFYRKTNTRVIVPNLPDFSHTRQNKSFWHSNQEKAIFIKDFLSKLNISIVDCLISHSYGCQTIAALWEEVKFNFFFFAIFKF